MACKWNALYLSSLQTRTNWRTPPSPKFTDSGLNVTLCQAIEPLFHGARHDASTYGCAHGTTASNAVQRSLLFVQQGDIPAASAAHTLRSILVLVFFDQALGSGAPLGEIMQSLPQSCETWESVPSGVGPLMLH